MGVGEEDPREKVPFLSYHFTGTHYTRLLPGGLDCQAEGTLTGRLPGERSPIHLPFQTVLLGRLPLWTGPLS